MDITGAYSSIPTVDQKTTGTTPTGAVAGDKLKLDFLKLLVAQLQYQDPLQPESNTEFTSQMAQFSSLDAQQQSNQILQKLLDSQSTGQMNQAVSYIGKQVVASGNQTVVKDGAATVRFQMPSAGTITVQLYNQQGELVKSAGPTFVPSGEGSAILSGAGLAGTTLPDGDYTFSVSMEGSNGAQVAVPTLEAGLVTGVNNSDTGLMLNLGGRLVALKSVNRIEQGNG